MHCDLGGALARASKRVACALLLDFIDRLVCCSEPFFGDVKIDAEFLAEVVGGGLVGA